MSSCHERSVSASLELKVAACCFFIIAYHGKTMCGSIGILANEENRLWMSGTKASRIIAM